MVRVRRVYCTVLYNTTEGKNMHSVVRDRDRMNKGSKKGVRAHRIHRIGMEQSSTIVTLCRTVAQASSGLSVMGCGTLPYIPGAKFAE